MAAAKWPTHYIGTDALSPAPAKAVADSYWARYEEMCGHNSGGVYVVLVPYKSLAEVDAGFDNAKKFADQMGESGIKKIAEMSASSTESIESNLLMFNPKISYPGDEWVKADPGFWKPKPAALAIASEGARSIGPQPTARPKFSLNAAQLGTATYGCFPLQPSIRQTPF